MDAIVKGCDWFVDITIEPTSGSTNAEVITTLTGATVAASLRFLGSAISPAPTAAVQDANARTVRVTYAAANTAQLALGELYNLDVRVTKGGLTYPVEVFGTVRVVASL